MSVAKRLVFAPLRAKLRIGAIGPVGQR
jgi:hypothetical protein